MKKIIVVALVFSAVVVSTRLAVAQNNDRVRQNRAYNGRFMQEARAEDGRFDLSKLLANERASAALKEAFKAADKDADGFLTNEEMNSALGGAFNNPQGGGRHWGGPGFGGRPGAQPGFGARQTGRRGFQAQNGRPRYGAPQGQALGGAVKDAKIDLSKLPGQLPEVRKEQMKAADKDGDGFLSMDEFRAMPKPGFPFKEREKPTFVNDDNALVLEQFDSFLKEFDKNNDGLLDNEEQKAIAETLREKSALPCFLNQALVGAPQFGGLNRFQGAGFAGQQPPRFGMAQGGGFGGPQGGGFGGPHGFGWDGPRGGGFGPLQGFGFGNPWQGGFGTPPRFAFSDAFKEGKLDLSKLPEQTPQDIKDKMKAADKDGDGFLSGDEFMSLAPPPGFCVFGFVGSSDVQRDSQLEATQDKPQVEPEEVEQK